MREVFKLTPIIMIALGEPNLSYGNAWVEHVMDHGPALVLKYNNELQLAYLFKIKCLYCYACVALNM